MIRSFVKKTEVDAISKNNSWIDDDPRNVDIALDTRQSTPSQRFRGWLGRYAWAESYMIWAQSTYSCSRTSLLNLDAKDAESKAKGHITEYLSIVSQGETTRKSIQHGLKYHAFKHIYGNHGILVLLIHLFTAFRDLNYSHLQSLAEVIHDCEEWSTLAEEKTEWLSKCRSEYNKSCEEYRRRQRNRKRLLELEGLPEQGQSKHARTNVLSTLPTESINVNGSVGDGYDPFEVDFNYLLQELDDQNPEISGNVLSLAARDNEAGLNSYDPFTVDFNFIH
ncbi:uncharacterized protein N7482_006860 [Penicillium canariense]|uniref:Uncharacterized protein n=1 Tax=Penicillium canariense TaxID=189055 RepID=A0A9W9LK15_9EURO|nr:uncharacterized protein N7482_006860 [Penicillium canariense]KAJ5159856.1 hypothetical protein N7482_006860 [Penicillium canariense]